MSGKEQNMADIREPGDRMEEYCGVFGIYDATGELNVCLLYTSPAIQAALLECALFCAYGCAWSMLSQTTNGLSTHDDTPRESIDQAQP